MKTKRIKISAVSYLNTLPFIYGIEHTKFKNGIELSLDMPSDCAKKLLNNAIDLGLVPVAILPQLKSAHIVSDFCIGAKGKVDSVALYSEVPLNQLESIYLDYQSKTSVKLAQVLAAEFWKINPDFIAATKGFENKIKGKTGGIIIGDRTFKLAKKYPYKYDLAEEWFAFTGLPFVFACWVSNKPLPETFVKQFNEALAYGLKNMEEAVATSRQNIISNNQLITYLTQHIAYDLDAKKRKAIDQFLGFVKAI